MLSRDEPCSPLPLLHSIACTLAADAFPLIPGTGIMFAASRAETVFRQLTLQTRELPQPRQTPVATTRTACKLLGQPPPQLTGLW
jgi:hypothetical protein